MWWLALASMLGAVPEAGSDGFTARFEHQARLAVVDASLDAREPGATHALSLRSLFGARLQLGRWALVGELQDARAYAYGPATRTGTDIVNPLEPIQALGELRLGPKKQGPRLRLGRMTLNLGSRRLVGRQVYRNAINAFTGGRFDWERSGLGRLTAFAVLPQQRRPADPEDLFDNDIQLDAERPRQVLAGIFFDGAGEHGTVWSPELYVFTLWESERADGLARRLVTPGGRVVLELEGLEFQLEAALQLGRSRSERGQEDLLHLAGMLHARVRKRWERTDLNLGLDFASGDQDPEDDVNSRFDSLFGVQIQDFGFTGLWSNFARSNIISPFGFARFRLVDDVTAFLRYRPAWLAASADTWAGTGLRDPDGGSGRFLGHQIETTVSVQIAEPLNLRIGGAALALGQAGRSLRERGGVVSRGPPILGFTQLRFSL